MKTVAVAFAILALSAQVLAAPNHQGPDHPTRTTSALQWIGPIAPAGDVYTYYGNIKDVGMQMIRVARDAEVHQVGGHTRRRTSNVVCSRADQKPHNYAETWAAYKLAAVLGALASTNATSVVAIEGGHGHCVDLTACGEAERARIQLCNDNPKPISVKIQTIAEYAYKVIYECAKHDGSGLIWGQQFDTKNYNVIISACPAEGH